MLQCSSYTEEKTYPETHGLTFLMKYSLKIWHPGQVCFYSNMIHCVTPSSQKTNTPQTKLIFFKKVFINLRVRAVEQILNAFSRLLLQSAACQASSAWCWVVTLSTPRLCSSTAGWPSTPAAPAAINGYVCQKGATSYFISLCQYLSSAKKEK